MNRDKRNWLAVVVLTVATLALSVATRSGVGAPQPLGLHFAAPVQRPVAFEGHLDRTSVLRDEEGLVRMQLVMRGEPREGNAPRVPTDLVVVLDRSGSMNGEKMIFARAAIHELLARLGPQDRFGLVAYSDHAAFPIPLGPATPQARSLWAREIAAILPGGSTNMSAGLDLGLGRILARGDQSRTPRVILISDGLANRGDSSVQGLTARAQRAAHGEFTLSAVGVGLDFNEQVMTAIADAGTGNYYFLESALGLARVFAAEFDAARATVASALELLITPGPGVRVLEAAGYPLENAPDGVRIRPGALFAGQERSIWVTLAVGGDELGKHELGRFALSYTDRGRRRETSFTTHPFVTRVASQDEFIAGVDKPRFEQAVKEEGFGRLQQRVSDYVRGGRFDEADAAIESFVDGHESLNESLDSLVLEAEITRARDLKRSVSGAAASPKEQNKFGKKKGYEARKLRRPGSQGGSR